MESIDFFGGTRTNPPLVFSFYDGKAKLVCTINENWGQLILHSIRCGGKYSRKLKRAVGIVYTEKDDLESLVSGSLGLKGIASLDSQLSAKSGVELQLNRSEEIEQEFAFESPKCGERVIALYQFRRFIELQYRDDRPFHNKEWSKPLTYWVDRIHDNSYLVPEIPECGCKAEDTQPEDGKVYVDIGNVTMTTGFIEDANSLRIPSLDLEIDKSKLHQTIQFHRNKLPDYLLFMAGDISEIVEAKLTFKDTAIRDVNKPTVNAVGQNIAESYLQQADIRLENLQRLGEFYPTIPINMPAGSLQQLWTSYVLNSLAEKTEFDVVLKDSGPRKIEVIKIIRDLTNLGLVEAKALAETAGGKVLRDVSREDALAAVRKLRSAGADVDTE